MSCLLRDVEILIEKSFLLSFFQYIPCLWVLLKNINSLLFLCIFPFTVRITMAGKFKKTHVAFRLFWKMR